MIDNSETLEFIKSRRLRGAYLDVGYGSGVFTRYFSGECEASLVLAIDGDCARTESLETIVRSIPYGRSRILAICAFVSKKNRSSLIQKVFGIKVFSLVKHVYHVYRFRKTR